MKKIYLVICLVWLTTFYACGPSKTEIAKQEKAKLDAIRMDDSIASSVKKAKFIQDSVANAASVAKEKARLDSIANAKTQHHKKGTMSKVKKH